MGSTESGKGFKSHGEYQHNIGDAGMPTGAKAREGMLHKPKEAENIHLVFFTQENLYSSDRLAPGFEKRTKPKFLGMYESKKPNYHRHPLCPPSLGKPHVI